VRKTRAALVVAADQLDVDIDHPPLVVANPLQGQHLAVPSDVRLGDTPDGEPAIHWQLPPAVDKYETRFDWARGGTADQAFWAFVDLAAADDPSRFVSFAQRFGVLGLWPYKTPKGHPVLGISYWPPSILEGIQTPYRYSQPVDRAEYLRIIHDGVRCMRYEPVSEWRCWAGWFRTTIEIAFALREGRLGTKKQWEALDVDFPFSTDPAWQKTLLARYVQERIVHWSGLAPVLQWGDRGPSLALTLGGEDAIYMWRSSFQVNWPPNSLYPALVAHLLALLAAGTPMAACSNCAKLHARSRRARSDQPSYCSDACRQEAIKATKRASAARTRKRERGLDRDDEGRDSGVDHLEPSVIDES
jgi:hypothetical protein